MPECIYCRAPGDKYHSDHECKQRLIRERDRLVAELQGREATLTADNEKLSKLIKRLATTAQASLDTQHECVLEGYISKYGCEACDLKITQNLEEVLKDFQSALKVEDGQVPKL